MKRENQPATTADNLERENTLLRKTIENLAGYFDVRELYKRYPDFSKKVIISANSGNVIKEAPQLLSELLMAGSVVVSYGNYFESTDPSHLPEGYDELMATAISEGVFVKSDDDPNYLAVPILFEEEAIGAVFIEGEVHDEKYLKDAIDLLTEALR